MSERTSKGLAFFAIALAIVAVSWRLISSPGVPVFHHDWSWPSNLAQMHSQAMATLQPVNRDNFGTINYYQFNAPFWVASDLIAHLLGCVTGLRIVITGTLFAAGLGMFRLIRVALGASPAASGAAAVLYVSNPIVANRLAAGHLTYLVCYALFPVVAACLIGIGRRSSLLGWCVLLCVTPFALVHPQFYFFYFLLVAVVAITIARRASLLFALCIPLLISPYMIAAAIGGTPGSDLGFERTTLRWQFVNSAELLDAIELTGSVRDYDKQASPALLSVRRAAIWLLWLAALAAAIRTPKVRPYLSVAIAGVLLHSGLHGPLAVPLSFLFERFEGLSLFREFYHFAVLTAFGLTVSVAAAFRSRPAILWLLVLATAAAQFSNAYANHIAFSRDTEMSAIGAIVAADRADGAVVFLPMLQPLGPPTASHGVDPDAFPIGSHAAIHAFLPQSPLVQIDLALRRRPEDAERILRTFGVRYVVIRPSWRSHFPDNLEPKLKELLAQHPDVPERLDTVEAHLHVVWRGASRVLARIDDVPPMVRSSPLTALRRIPTSAAPLDVTIVADPREGWADALRWFWWSGAIADVVNPGILTLSKRPLTVDVPERGALSVGSTGSVLVGPSSAGGIVRGPLLGEVAVAAGPAIVVPQRGLTMYGGYIEPGVPHSDASQNGCSNIERLRFAWSIVVPPRCDPASLEVVANRSLGWRLREAGQTILPDPRRWDFQYRLHPGVATLDDPLLDRLHIFESLQYAAWAACLLSAVVALALWLRGRARRTHLQA